MTRRTQQERTETTRAALLLAAARAVSRGPYASIRLLDVAADAGLTRGAIYHHFPTREALTVAVLEWIESTWEEEVGVALRPTEDPVGALLTTARLHAAYCRNGVASAMQVLSVEFPDGDTVVGREVARITRRLASRVERLVLQARDDELLPAGPPASRTADAYLAAIEAVAIAVDAPHDVHLVEAAARGVLGLPPS